MNDNNGSPKWRRLPELLDEVADLLYVEGYRHEAYQVQEIRSRILRKRALHGSGLGEKIGPRL